MYFICLRCSQNILDANLVAKLSDFGFGMQLLQQLGSTQLITAVVGGTLASTRGYLALEGKHGVKNIYSYGVTFGQWFPHILKLLPLDEMFKVLYLIYITYNKSIYCIYSNRTHDPI